MNKVSIFFKDQLAGKLEKTAVGEFIFEYNQDYLSAKGPALSLTLPVDQKKFESSDLFPFFDGLIPEGWLLNLASSELRLNPLSDRFELLSKLCRDSIGAVHIGEKVAPPPPLNVSERKKVLPNFGKCLICYHESKEVYHQDCMLSVFGQSIDPLVDIDEEVLETLAKHQLNKSLALAGVQKKLSLEILEEKGKKSRMTVTDLWGKYIFKPKGGPPHLPENEHLCLKLAASFKIQVVKAALIPTNSEELGFLTKRFDRHDGNIEFHQEDFCQILNKPAYKKYNASLEQVGKVLKAHADFPGDNLYRLYELTIFNFIIGNVDFHLKNITLIYENPEGKKKILAPAYDLLSTDLYIKDDNEESALAINGKKNKLTEDDFLMLANKLGISEKVHQTLIRKLRDHLPKWWDLIDRSFLENNKKEEFKSLIEFKLSRFSSSPSRLQRGK